MLCQFFSTYILLKNSILIFLLIFQIEEIIRIHGCNSPGHFQRQQKCVQLSLDGVAETKSTTITLEVFSIKFEGCRDVYPIKIVRPISKDAVDNKEQFNTVLNSVLLADLILSTVVGDNPKRAFLRNSFQHSGKFGCEYCFESGVPFSQTTTEDPFLINIKEQINSLNAEIDAIKETGDQVQVESLKKLMKNLIEAENIGKKNRQSSHIVWPANTFNGELRTKEKVLEIVQKIESGEILTAQERKGIKGRSPLLDIDYFDYVISVPTEYMHSGCLGLVKRLLELSFSVGEKRIRNTKRPLSSPNLFNDLVQFVKFTREFSRRIRKLDLSVMKAQELRNVLIFLFPIVTQCLDGDEKEIKLWEMLAFIVRACIIPENEFEAVNVNEIKYCQKKFYSLYQQLFGYRNCTYSVHVVISHLLMMRAQGPLTQTSAFVFEAFYAELRNSFQPGTASVLKQMMTTVMLKRMLTWHVCEEKIYLKEKDSAMECNSLIYVYESDKHVIYKIVKIEGNETLICNKIGNHDVDFPYTNMLNWSAVGVYRKGAQSCLNVIVSRQQMAGKVIKVGNYLITCPVNILREK